MLEKSRRKITRLFIHCSATMPHRNVRAADIRRWHKEQGWSDIGYHYVICRDGEVEAGRSVHKTGAHAKGHNTGTLAICMIGGLGKDNRPAPDYTQAQWRALDRFISQFRATYPGATIHGHNEVSDKACPSFDVQEFLQSGRIEAVR